MKASFLDLVREHRTETVPPEPHCLVTDVEAPLEEQIFDLPQRQRIADILHHREADDLGRTVEISEGITHRRRLGMPPARLKPIYSDNAMPPARLKPIYSDNAPPGAPSECRRSARRKTLIVSSPVSLSGSRLTSKRGQLRVAGQETFPDRSCILLEGVPLGPEGAIWDVTVEVR
jgi:hypothetical protein